MCAHRCSTIAGDADDRRTHGSASLWVAVGECDFDASKIRIEHLLGLDACYPASVRHFHQLKTNAHACALLMSRLHCYHLSECNHRPNQVR